MSDDREDVFDAPDIDELDSDPEASGTSEKGSALAASRNAKFLRWLLNPNDHRPLRVAMAGVLPPAPRKRSRRLIGGG